MTFLTWAILLFLLGMALFLLELFIPSAGILGASAVAAFIAATVMGFRHSLLAGLGVLTSSVVLMPMVLVVAVKIWPVTPMGKRILLGVPKSDDVLPDDPRKELAAAQVGKVGRAKTSLLPSGVVNLDGTIVDAVSEGMPIDADQWVRVVAARGSRVVVRPVEQEEFTDVQPDDLDRPVDALGIEPPDEPLV